MKEKEEIKTIFTIGHSNRSYQEFHKMLSAFGITLLVDIRLYPGSSYASQFNKETLSVHLQENGIQYIHLPKLGGRREPDKNSANTGWKNKGFRGFADYMQSASFAEGINELMALTENNKVAIMCAEAVPWRCHRSLVSDALLVKGIHVMDIFTEKQVKEHKMTPFAVVKNSKILYPPEEKELDLK